jgi:multidrug efflux system outer membrane protein
MNPSTLARFSSAARPRLAFTLVASTLVTGCALGPDYERPKLPAPETFRGASKPDSPTSFADVPFWKAFSDPALVALVREGIAQNLDLAIAAQRVEVARQTNRAAYWALFPTLGANVGAGQAHGTGSAPGVFPPLDVTGRFGGSVVGSWEIDLWGRLRRTIEATQSLADATEEDRRGLYVALVGDVASQYFELRILDAQIGRGRAQVEVRKRTLALFQERLTGGVGNDLEVARAQANVRDAEAQVELLEQRVAYGENALSFLLGRVPGPVVRSRELESFGAPPAVAAGLPSTLLERRPDVRAAERRVAAANAGIGIATANFFPRFDLTGFLGVLSKDLGSFTKAASTEPMYGGVGAFGFTVPLLGGEKLRANLTAAEAELEASKLAYRRQALGAFRDVADALVRVEKSRMIDASRTAQVEALRRAAATAEERFRGGVSNYLELLTAQEELLRSEFAAADARGQQHLALVGLYRALGGGYPTAALEAGKAADAATK